MDPRPGVMVTPALRLLEPLREGAMGSVWVADHLERGERVAVKFVSSQGANEDPESATRLRREAKAALRVDSNHVVRVVDHGETEDGTPYVAMELLVGESVGERVRRSGPIPLEDVVVIVEQAGDAIEAAHKAGIVHRDIKPDNLFLTKDNGELHVKVLDFGFARAIQLPDTTRELTAPGMMVGTPKLVSPDQLLNPTRVTPSRDLWALAIVAYYALTGVYPFEADPLPELLKRILVCQHAPPSQHAPGLPPEVDAWFARALARDPKARFDTVGELIDALRAAAAMPKQPYFPDSKPTKKLVADTLADVPRAERSGTNDGITYRRRTMSDEIDVDEEEPLDAELVSVAAPASEPPPPPPSAIPPSSRAHPPSSRAQPTPLPTRQPIVEICILELDKNPEPHRAARLHYEIARQAERNGDQATAIEHYRNALTKVSEHRPSLRALRQLTLHRRERGAIELFDAEAALATKSEKVQLVVAKARALEEVFDDAGAARFALDEAAKLDPSDLGPLVALWQHAAAGDRREALGLLERVSNVIAGDEPLKAVFLAEQARMAEHLGDAERAETLYRAALASGSLGALDACARLAHARGAHRELVGLLERDAASTEDPSAKASTLALIARIQSYHLDNPEAARVALTAAVAVRPEDRYLLQSLARVSDGEALAKVLEQL
ncbi:MAG TPA: protein kinase, partial [Polyangiaceae bacterium]|nr:protein kinase [Polyangiaceae bacterium]